MMDPLWSETRWSTFQYFITLIVSIYYILCISWIIKCLIIIDARCKHEEEWVFIVSAMSSPIHTFHVPQFGLNSSNTEGYNRVASLITNISRFSASVVWYCSTSASEHSNFIWFVTCNEAREENICWFKVNIINIVVVHLHIPLYFVYFSGRTVPFARTASGVWVVKASNAYSVNYWCIRSATNWYRNPAAMNRWSLYLKKKQTGRRQQSVSHHWLLSSRNRKFKFFFQYHGAGSQTWPWGNGISI